MRKQEIIDYNLVNFDKLIAANYPKSVFINDFNLDEPETGYLTSGKGYGSHKYTSILYMSSSSMYEFGFTNRNRLRNWIKKIQSYDDCIVARFIVEVKHEQQ